MALLSLFCRSCHSASVIGILRESSRSLQPPGAPDLPASLTPLLSKLEALPRSFTLVLPLQLPLRMPVLLKLSLPLPVPLPLLLALPLPLPLPLLLLLPL